MELIPLETLEGIPEKYKDFVREYLKRNDDIKEVWISSKNNVLCNKKNGVTDVIVNLRKEKKLNIFLRTQALFAYLESVLTFDNVREKLPEDFFKERFSEIKLLNVNNDGSVKIRIVCSPLPPHIEYKDMNIANRTGKKLAQFFKSGTTSGEPPVVNALACKDILRGIYEHISSRSSSFAEFRIQGRALTEILLNRLSDCGISQAHIKRIKSKSKPVQDIQWDLNYYNKGRYTCSLSANSFMEDSEGKYIQLSLKSCSFKYYYEQGRINVDDSFIDTIKGECERVKEYEKTERDIKEKYDISARISSINTRSIVLSVTSAEGKVKFNDVDFNGEPYPKKTFSVTIQDYLPVNIKIPADLSVSKNEIIEMIKNAISESAIKTRTIYKQKKEADKYFESRVKGNGIDGDIIAKEIVKLINKNAYITDNIIVKILRDLSLSRSSFHYEFDEEDRVFNMVPDEYIRKRISTLKDMDVLKERSVHGEYGTYYKTVSGKRFDQFCELIDNATPSDKEPLRDIDVVEKLKTEDNISLFFEILEKPAVIPGNYELMREYVNRVGKDQILKFLKMKKKTDIEDDEKKHINNVYRLIERDFED